MPWWQREIRPIKCGDGVLEYWSAEKDIRPLTITQLLHYSNTPFLPNIICAAGFQPDLLIENRVDAEIIPAAAAFDFVAGG